MKFAYDIAWLIAVSVDLCVIVAFLKAIVLKWLDISLQNILEEKKARIQEREIGVSEAIILQREARRVEE